MITIQKRYNFLVYGFIDENFGRIPNNNEKYYWNPKYKREKSLYHIANVLKYNIGEIYEENN